MNTNSLTQARIKEILARAKTDKDLFNWCDEYNQFIDDNVYICLSEEIDYILKKSVEDANAPLSYDDLDLFDCDRAREHLIYEYEFNQEEFKDYANNPDTFNRRVKIKDDFEVFVKSLNKEELKQAFSNLDIDISNAEGEVYEWYAVGDRLYYLLEAEEEILLNGYLWGRQTTGQSVKLDCCVMDAFLNWLNGMVRE